MAFSDSFHPQKRTSAVIRPTSLVEVYWPEANELPWFRVKPNSRSGWMGPAEADAAKSQLAALLHRYQTERDA